MRRILSLSQVCSFQKKTFHKQAYFISLCFRAQKRTQGGNSYDGEGKLMNRLLIIPVPSGLGVSDLGTTTSTQIKMKYGSYRL